MVRKKREQSDRKIKKALEGTSVERLTVKKAAKKKIVDRNRGRLSSLLSKVTKKREEGFQLNMSASDIRRISRALGIPLSENITEKGLKRALKSVSTEKLLQDRWTLWRLFMQKDNLENKEGPATSPLSEDNTFKVGDSYSINLWHKKAYWGVGLHAFLKGKNVGGVEITQYGERGLNGIAKLYPDGKYYFVNHDGSQGAYAAIFNMKFKIKKMLKPGEQHAAVQPGKFVPPAQTNVDPMSAKFRSPETTPELATVDKAKTALLLKAHRSYYRNGKHKVPGQCEGMSIVVIAKMIQKMRKNSGYNAKFLWKSLRKAPLHTATKRFRGQYFYHLKYKDFAKPGEPHTQNKIPVGTVFFVARMRSGLRRFMRGTGRNKLAPIIKSSGRHWFIYAGVDSYGRPIFIDNHWRKNGKASLGQMQRFIGDRMVINLYNPFTAYDEKMAVNSSGNLTTTV